MSDQNPSGFNTAIGNALLVIELGDTRVACREKDHRSETVDFEKGYEVIGCFRCGAERVVR